MDLVIGVDMATAEVRAVAADAGGRIHEKGSARLPGPERPRGGWVEQDARTWWPAVQDCLRQVTDGLGRRANSVVGLSVCGTSGTVVAVDRDGEPLGPALMYSDQRATEEADTAQAAGERRWARLGLRIQPSFGLAKWGWLTRHGPPSAHLVHAPDIVVARLTGGRPPTDWSHALKSGYDPDRQEWAEEALAALQIPMAAVPEVRSPATAAGPVAAAAAEATGLPVGCEVRLGMTDACASQLAAGAGTPGRFVSVLGTTLAVKGASHDLVVDPDGAVYSHRHPDGWWLPGGASNVGGSALKEGFAERDLAALDEEAASRGPAGCVTYPLGGRGERFPFVEPEAAGFVLGAPADDVEHYRALLEGVAFVERLGYERLARLGATIEDPVAASGTGSSSRPWNRVRATVLGRPLVEKPGASTALGACILAAAGTLHRDLSDAIGAMAVSGPTVEPADDEREPLEASYQRLLAALADRGWYPDD